MLVLGINKILNWCGITNGGRSYTCPTKIINNDLCFKFKNQWHKVSDYICEHTEELVEEGGKIISKKFKK